MTYPVWVGRELCGRAHVCVSQLSNGIVSRSKRSEHMCVVGMAE